MNDHYFSPSPKSVSQPSECISVYHGLKLNFETDAGVFSRDGLDKGTAILLDSLPALTGPVLDLGCGWGAVGISVKKACTEAELTMVDINSRAVELSKKNAQRNGVRAKILQSDGFGALPEEKFSFILSNPPIRAGKQVIYDLFQKAAEHLLPGGCLYLVIRKQQGAASAVTYLKTVFYAVSVIEKSGGYWVIRADKEL